MLCPGGEPKKAAGEFSRPAKPSPAFSAPGRPVCAPARLFPPGNADRRPGEGLLPMALRGLLPECPHEQVDPTGSRADRGESLKRRHGYTSPTRPRGPPSARDALAGAGLVNTVWISRRMGESPIDAQYQTIQTAAVADAWLPACRWCACPVKPGELEDIRFVQCGFPFQGGPGARPSFGDAKAVLLGAAPVEVEQFPSLHIWEGLFSIGRVLANWQTGSLAFFSGC